MYIEQILIFVAATIFSFCNKNKTIIIQILFANCPLNKISNTHSSHQYRIYNTLPECQK